MTSFVKKLHLGLVLLGFACIGQVNAQTTPCCKQTCWGNLSITGEFLYWRAFESGLDNCVPRHVSDRTTRNGHVFSEFKGKGRDLNFKWDPGYRIGANYEFASCEWDVAASWTHFHSSANGSGHRKWNINLDVIDVTTGYEPDCGLCFDVRPFIGLRGAQIDQKLHVGHRGGSHKRLKEEFEGLGPLLGLGFNWEIGCNFSLYVNVSAAWLYGNFHVKTFESDKLVDARNVCRLSKHLDANIAAGDAEIGVRWQRCFCNTKQFYLQLGLEHHRYFNFNRIGCYGDLSFDGANVGLGIGF